MKIEVRIDRRELEKMILEKLSEKLGREVDDTQIGNHVSIQVKSKQNYKSEWENADFRATYEGEI